MSERSRVEGAGARVRRGQGGGAVRAGHPLARLQQTAGNRAVQQLVGGARPVQRDPDPQELLDMAAQTQEGPGPLGGMITSFSNAIGDDAESGNLGMGTLQKAAKAEEARENQKGAELRASQKEFDSDVDAAAKWTGDGAGARFAGGAIKEAWGIGTGLESIVQNPLGFQKAQAEKGSKEAVPMVTDQYFKTLGKVSRGEEGLGGAASELFGAYTKGKDNEWEAKEKAAQPITDDVKSGNYAGAFGRLGTQIGVAVLGMGEEGPLGEVAAEANAGEQGVRVAAGETGQGARAVSEGASEISPAAESVPNPGGVLEPPISPAAESVPNPGGALEPPISPAAESVPNPGGALESPISPEAESVPNPTERGLPPTERGIPPTERGIPPTERGLPPTERGEPPTLRDLPGFGPDEGPLTIPGLGPAEGPLTLPGLGPQEGPLTIPGLGPAEGPGPSTLPGVAPDPNPLPDLAPDTTPGGPPTLESPTEFQGERVPEQSPLAESVKDPPGGQPSPNPDLEGPATQRSPGNESRAAEQAASDPAPQSEGSGPATADGDQLANAQEQFEQAWGQFSKEPFGYGLLP